MHLLHSEKRFKRMDDADKADVVKRIQDKVKGYFGNLEETNSIFEQNLRNDQDITDDTEEAVHNGPGVMPTPEPSPAAAAPESTPIQTAATEPTSPAPTSPAGTATADQTGSQDVNVGQNAAVAEEEPAKDVETEDEGNADTYTEDNDELDINTVDEGEINISTEESPAVDISTVETPTTEIQTDETNAVVEFNTEEEHEAHVEDLGTSNTAAVTTEDTVPTEYCDTHIKVTICNDTGKIARTGCTNTSTKILIKKSAINIPADIENPEDEKEYTTWDQDYSITQEELDSPCTKHSGTSTYKATSSVINSGTSGSTSTRPSGTGSTTTPATLPSGSTGTSGTTSGNGTTSNGTTSNGSTSNGTTGTGTTGSTSSGGTTTNRR